ncbi:MAG: DNA-binding protein WhiA, partial [Atopostipes suicloacalis]|nr:DNA-binding protein WhiA [Atopostipes suicloacalis]
SYASEVKKELTMLEVHPEHAKAELAALIRLNGSIIKKKGKGIITVQTENAAIARRIYSLLKDLFDVQLEISVRRRMKLKKNNVYFIRVMKDANPVLRELEILDAMSEGVNLPKNVKGNEQKARSYLRGAFLARGSVNSPETKSYHLEIHSNSAVLNQDNYDLMEVFDLNPKIHERKNGGYMTYLKEAEKIADFLGIIGANNSLFRFEDIRIVRDMRNSVNRLVNCEQANLNKTVDAARRQIEAILLIDEKIGLDNLDDKTKAIAQTRLENPEASLKELGELISGKSISKSAANHRMRKIMKMAEEFEED